MHRPFVHPEPTFALSYFRTFAPMKAVIFDVGNTLLWLDHPFVVGLLREFGIETTQDELIQAEYGAKLLLDELVRTGRAGNDAERGKAHWDARYTFTQTGRRVHNRIDARFLFRDGLIIRHEDTFSFWRWARQALGPAGLLLGWAPPLRAKVRSTARGNLRAFMRKADTAPASPA